MLRCQCGVKRNRKQRYEDTHMPFAKQRRHPSPTHGLKQPSLKAQYVISTTPHTPLLLQLHMPQS